jgi:hypothetical protein
MFDAETRGSSSTRRWDEKFMVCSGAVRETRGLEPIHV